MVPGHTVSISSSYNHVVHPQVVVRYSQKSTDSPQDRLTIPQAHPQICPEQQEGAGECTARTAGIPTPRCSTHGRPMMEGASADADSAHPASGGSPPSSRCNWSW